MKRIAIISDIHFGQDAGPQEFLVPGESKKNQSNDRTFEKRLIDLFKKMEPNYIFIAGDLTSKAEPQEFKYCEQEILKIAEKSNIDPKKIICCMGNHDVDWKITGLSKFTKDEATRFSNVQEVQETRKKMYHLVAENAVVHYLQQIKCNPQKAGTAAYTGVYEDEDFVLFVLHSSLDCLPDEKVKHGRLTDKQLNWLKESLKTYGSDKRKKMVMLHHHPHDYKFPEVTFEASKIEENADFREVVENLHVDIVIHGHRHHPGCYTYNSNSKEPITFFCAGSLSVDSDGREQGAIPNTVHFLDVDKTKDYIVLHNFAYRTSTGWFDMEDKPETPLDKEMRLGKVFTEEQCRKEIRKYKKTVKTFKKLSYDEIAEPLRYMHYNRLNNMMREELGSTHEISGNFPELVMIVPKESV